MDMDRRHFTALAAAPALAQSGQAQSGQAPVALITHNDGPHLSAYIEGLARASEAGSVALCCEPGAAEAAVRKGLGAKLGAVHRTPAELFAASKPVLALITMEAALAPPAIEAALRAGAHVMAEKPACVRPADFARLAALARANKRNLMLALANRIDPVMQEARRVVQSGEIGRPYGIEVHLVADQTRLTRPAYHKTWVARKERAGGGHLIWLGIHWLDLAMHITGSRIKDAAGFTANAGGQPIDTEDSAVAAVRFENGVLGTVTSGYYLDKGYHSSIKIWGSGGWLHARKHGGTPPLEWHSHKTGAHKYEGPLEPAGYTPWVRHAVRAAMGLEPPILTTDESLYALETVFAIYAAAESGRTRAVRA